VILVDRYAHSSGPAIRLSVDFGAGILVVGISQQDGCGYRTMEFPGWSQEMPGTGADGPVHGIPVLIHYDQDGSRTIGDEVERACCSDHPSTARWIRKYLLEGSPVRIQAGTDRQITFRDTAMDFLGTVLARAARECPGSPAVVFAIPPDAPEWYAGWLGSIARGAGMTSWYTLDEHAAAAAGYRLSVEEGKAFLVIRFDETGLTVSVVRREGSSVHSPAGELRVAGQACDDTGCRALDGWIAQDMLARNRMRYAGAKARQIHETIMGRIGEAYEQLAAADDAELEVAAPLAGTAISAKISRYDIDRIVTEHGFPSVIDRTTGRALATARSRGSGEDTLVAILMTGRGCAIPAVQELVKKRFPNVPVLCDRPFDAVARGAALFIPRENRTDRIRNDYALRYWDPTAREHRYRFLVRSGARYPSAGQVARITISAAYDGQTHLGIPLYEIITAADAHAPAFELVSDAAGGIRVAGPPDDASTGSRPVLVNERTPTLLVADPPAFKGDPRFEMTFTLDAEKHLRVTARDLVTGVLVKKDAPVHRLT
jgi:molecular chaperone DnaK (HSP70)